MKKKIVKICVLLLLVMCLFVGKSGDFSYALESDVSILEATENPEENTSTEPEEPENPEDPIDYEELIYEDLIKGGDPLDNTSDISDKSLYSALTQIVKQYIVDTYGYTEYDTSETLYSTMLKNIETIEIQNREISDLSGFEKLQLPKLKSLTIVSNKVTTIGDNFFDNMSNLESINLSCCQISSISLPKLSKLTSINLSSNKLKSINFAKLPQKNLDINLANNLFSNITDIGFSNKIESVHLNIINNNITTLEEEYFEQSKITFNIGVQGLVSKSSDEVTIDTSTPINFYKINIPGVYIKIYKEEGFDTCIDTVRDEDIEGNVLSKYFGVGSYYAEYYNAGGMIDTSANCDNKLYTSYSFDVIPSECTAKYEFKGKMYDTFEKKVTGKVRVYLSCEEGGTIYYKLGNGEWTQGNEIYCDKGGNYSIRTKVVIDDVESNEKTIFIKTSLNVVIPDFLMLILLLLFALTLFIVVVPLVSKKWFKK